MADDAQAVFLDKRRVKINSVSLNNAIEVDSCLDETHTLSNTITDHPVEEGFNASDHSRPNPDTVTLRCFISNTPLSQEQKTRSVREGSVSFDTTAPKATPGRGKEAFDKLKKLRDEGALIAVVTTLKMYGVTDKQGMMIESLSIQRTRQNFDGLEFTVTLKQVRIVQNRSTKAKKPREARTQKKAEKGEQPKKEEKKKTKDPLKTVKEAIL